MRENDEKMYQIYKISNIYSFFDSLFVSVEDRIKRVAWFSFNI